MTPRGADRTTCSRRRARAIMSTVLIAAALLLAARTGASAQSGAITTFGPYGPEGPRLREQHWLIPSGDGVTPLRATVFRPQDQAGRPAQRKALAVINHGTPPTARERDSLTMPVFFPISKWLVERNYVVVVPQRRGYGATGGRYVEVSRSLNCNEIDYDQIARISAEDIASTLAFMQRQSFVLEKDALVLGISTGGVASLALAARAPTNVAAVINFAGGRGGRHNNTPNNVCGQERLIEAIGKLGATARIPTLWIYAENDSFFNPALARSMLEAWQKAGANGELRIVGPFLQDGHTLAVHVDGVTVWGPILNAFLFRLPR